MVNLLYIFRVGIAIAVFYLAFMALFRKEKMFSLNRIYMIGALFAAFIIPLISFHKDIILPAAAISMPSLSTNAQPLQASASNDYQGKYIELIFLAGVIISSIHFIISHFKVWMIVKRSSRKTICEHSVWITSQNVPPFTYFNKLVIPSNLLDNPYLNIVVCHEQIHANEQHCLDIFLSEILCILQWFNPFAWLLKNAVRDNLEFSTDDLALRQINRKEYQLGMVSLASSATIFAFPPVSNKSQLKKRIIMMKKSKSNKKQWGKVLALAPILAILTVTLSCREERSVSENSSESVVTALGIPRSNSNGNTVEVSTIGGEKLNVPLIVIDGEKHPLGFEMSQIDPETIKSMTVLKSEPAIKMYGEDAKNGVMIIETKNNTGPGNIKDILEQSSSNSKNSSENVVTAIGIPRSNSNVRAAIRGEKLDKTLIIIDGKKHLPGTFDLGKMDPETIKSMTVLKGETATAKYGDEAKEGVIVVATKDNIK